MMDSDAMGWCYNVEVIVSLLVRSVTVMGLTKRSPRFSGGQSVFPIMEPLLCAGAWEDGPAPTRHTIRM